MIDHASQSPPHRSQPAKKGDVPRAIGRTKGGLNSKLHAVVNGEGKPVLLHLTAGQASDYKGAAALIDKLAKAKNLLADRGYDADGFRGLTVNHELIILYWQIGSDILARQQAAGWGAKVVERLARDLRATFPDTTGFSRSNLMSMRAFAAAYPDFSIVQQAVGQLPWGHNVLLLDRIKDPTERLWYVRQTIEFGWSRNILAHQIDTGLYARQGKALTNFDKTLPSPQSELAQQLIKDPYSFDFLTLGPDAKERELERGFTTLTQYPIRCPLASTGSHQDQLSIRSQSLLPASRL